MSSELVELPRRLKLSLPKGQSAFLWGIRKAGKSTYLKAHYPISIYVDLLDTDTFFELNSKPSRLRERVLELKPDQLAYPVIIDEVQKIPALLDEVHWLIENSDASFILCGSSARKLKREAANLLGGRAWSYYLRPFSYTEVPNFDLLHAFNAGLIPSHYLSNDYRMSLKSYVQIYLKEEIRAEGLVRNLANFSRFLEAIPFSHAELINYSNIGRDCGIDAKTVKEYYQILVDTLMGYLIYPFSNSETRDQVISATPKFYMVDIGLANHLAKRELKILKGAEAGKSFEQFILLELISYLDFQDFDMPIKFWRTKTEHEVDFVIPDLKLAIEVKISSSVDKEDLRSVFHFQDLYPEFKVIVVSQDSKARKIKTQDHELTIVPWREFLEALWKDEYSK